MTTDALRRVQSATCIIATTSRGRSTPLQRPLRRMSTRGAISGCTHTSASAHARSDVRRLLLPDRAVPDPEARSSSRRRRSRSSLAELFARSDPGAAARGAARDRRECWTRSRSWSRAGSRAGGGAGSAPPPVRALPRLDSSTFAEQRGGPVDADGRARRSSSAAGDSPKDDVVDGRHSRASTTARSTRTTERRRRRRFARAIGLGADAAFRAAGRCRDRRCRRDRRGRRQGRRVARATRTSPSTIDCFAFRHAMNPKFVSYFMQTAALSRARRPSTSRERR